MSYRATFILVAGDCPATTGIVPTAKAGRPTVPLLEYELLSRHPYTFTREDLLFEVHARRNDLSAEDLSARGADIRAEVLRKPHPCMRASALPKRYGWGVHHDEQGRIAIFPLGSPEYARLATSQRTTILKALRARRA